MKIKIFTFYYTNNFGAALQSLCLKSFIEDNLISNVTYSLYQPKDLIFKEIYRPLITKRPKKFFSILAKNINMSIWKKKLKLKKPIHNIDKIEDENEVCVYGSDEIWNFKNSYFGFDPFFFGEKNQQNKISYAPSIGISEFENLNDIEKTIIRKELEKFSVISVRDSNSSIFVEKLLNIKPQIVVDPTLLCTPSVLTNYISKKIPNYKYVVVYGTIFSTEQIKEIKAYCVEKNLTIISIGYMNSWVDKNLIALDPTDFFQIIQNASQVFTSMFHGIMFSVKLKKNFWYSVDPIRKNKINHFINELNLNNREIGDNTEFSDKINYDSVYLKLDKWIEESKNFLISNIKKYSND